MLRVTSPRERQALRDASQWFARMGASPDNPDIQAQWLAWHREHPSHQWAWERLNLLQSQMGSVPRPLAYRVLDRVTRQAPGLERRTLLKGLLLGVGLSAVGWRGYRESGIWLADRRTATGERRSETLADGTRLTLDTASAVDLRFDAATRLLILRAGAIHLSTGSDPRPLIVRSAEGDMRALGTRFSARQEDGKTRLEVFEHAVAVRPRQESGAEVIIQAGHKLHFSAAGTGPLERLASETENWTRGRLVVDGWRLDRLLAELQRYRSGYLGCVEQIGHLQVSGSYPLDDIDMALGVIARALPVRVERYTRYWTRLVPAA